MPTPFESYREKRKVADDQGQKIAILEAKLARAKKKLDRIKPHWVIDLVRPLGDALAREAGLHHCELAGPFGLAARVYVSLLAEGSKQFDKDPRTISFNVEPGDLTGTESDLLRLVDQSVDLGHYRPNSLGAMNGLNYGTIPIPEEISLASILWMIKRTAEKVEA